VNDPSWVDCDIFVFVDSSGNPNELGEILPLRISLDKPEGAVLIVSEEETMVDADGDSGMVIGIARGCWSVSGPGCTYGLILPVL
jgi:hypothetical protein